MNRIGACAMIAVHEWSHISKLDNGRLWGINLYAPTLCIDTNRTVWKYDIPYADRIEVKGNVEETDKWNLTKKEAAILP